MDKQIPSGNNINFRINWTDRIQLRLVKKRNSPNFWVHNLWI